MRLSVPGRLVHSLMAVALAFPLPRFVAQGDWIGVALGALGLAIFGVPALLGRNPMIDPTAVSRWARWIYVRDPLADPATDAGRGGKGTTGSGPRTP